MSDQSLTVRVSRSTHELLRSLAAQSGSTITAVIEQAARDLQRRRFWDDFNARCQALKADATAWADLREEDSVWDVTTAEALPKE